jgi:hypothetical protein
VEETRGPALIINDGSLAGLVACWAEGVVRPAANRKPGAAQTAPMAWFPMDDRPARERRREAIGRQVELCSLAGFSERMVMRFDVPLHAAVHEGAARGGKQSAKLFSAAVEAISLGMSRVIWPIHAGAARDVDIDALADVCDRALLVGQLVGLDAPRSADSAALRIETPYADLTDAQVMDLALDMDVPLHAAWWCLNEDPQPCGQCAACMRWREALAAVDPVGQLDIQVLAAAPARSESPIGPLKHA